MIGDIHNDCYESKSGDLSAESLFAITHAPIKSDIAQSALHKALSILITTMGELERENELEAAYGKKVKSK